MTLSASDQLSKGNDRHEPPLTVALIGNITLDICVSTAFARLRAGRQTQAPIALRAGGGIPNVGRVLSALSVPVVAIGALGSDPAGLLLAQELPWPVPSMAGASTEISVIDVTGERSIINQQGSAVLDAGAAAAKIPAGAVVVFAYLNCCSIPAEQLPDLCSAAHDRASTVVAGLNGVFSNQGRDAVLSNLNGVDLLIANQFEASWLAGTSSFPAVLEFLSASVQRAVITLGSRGAVCVESDQVLHLPAEEAHEPRTLGAGDAFLAGVAAGIAEGQSYADAYDLGRIVAGNWVRGKNLSQRLPVALSPPTAVRDVSQILR